LAGKANQMSQTRLPDFVVIGAGKSGTTSLNEYLKEHPQIFMSTRKEPNFFAFELAKESDFELESSKEFYRDSVLNLEDYLTLFKGAKEPQLLGEVSNTYLNNEMACQRLKHYIPNTKLIAILRHPADRLFSRYSHYIREGLLPVDGGLENVFDKSTSWWQRPDMITEGLYYGQVKRYYDNFPKENIRIYLYENFINDTAGVVEDIFKFLEIDTKVKVATDIVYNKSGTVKNKAVDNLVGQNSAVILTLKKFAPGLHHWMKDNVLINRWLYNMRNKNLQKADFSPELRKEIVNKIYAEDIGKLSDLIGQDLSHWLKV
jgi:hypothetical protein